MTTSRRSLRVGIVIGGQLVEEKSFAVGTAVTFGQSLACALSVPLEDLPREHVLFTADHALRPPAGAEVTGSAQRGKVVLGDVTLLFQEVTPPVPLPRPQLPAGLRVSLADRIDRRLAAIIGGSLAVHVAIASYAWMTDVPEQPSFASVPLTRTYDEHVIDLDTLLEPPAPTTPGAAAPVTPSQTPRPIVQPARVTAVTPRPAQPVDSHKLASLLTGSDGEVGRNGMSSRQPGASLQQQINAAKDSGAQIGDGTQTAPRVDDRLHIADHDRPLTNDPTLTQAPRPTRVEPTGRVIPGRVTPESHTTLSPQTVLDRINTLYMAGLQRCYRLGLATDSTLAGRVAISFTVDERGHVIDPDAAGLSPEVDRCIRKQMSTWRFPIPKDGDGDATDATFSVSLALQPS